MLRHGPLFHHSHLGSITFDDKIRVKKCLLYHNEVSDCLDERPEDEVQGNDENNTLALSHLIAMVELTPTIIVSVEHDDGFP